MRNLYKAAYSALRYKFTIENSWGDNYSKVDEAKFAMRKDVYSEIINLPIIAVGAAYKSFVCEEAGDTYFEPGRFVIRDRQRQRKKHNTWVKISRKKAESAGLISDGDTISIRLDHAERLGL